MFSTKKLWKHSLSPREWWTLLIVGGVGGIFPDIDLFYTHAIDASESHRLLVTHTPGLYIALALAGLAVTAVFHLPQWRRIIVAFCMGAISHTIADGIMGNIMYLFPFSRGFYGLSDINSDWLSMHLIFINFLRNQM